MKKLTLIESKSEALNFKKIIPPANRRSLGRTFSDYNKFKVIFDEYSISDTYQRYLTNLADILDKEIPVSEIDDGGILDQRAVNSDFSRLRTMPGSVRIPLSFNRPETFSNEVLNKNIRFWNIADEFISCFFKEHTGARGMISRDSSSGSPLFTNNLSLKHKHLSLISKNLDFLKRIYSNKDIDRQLLYEKLMVCNVATTQIRLQNDAWKNGKVKERKRVTFAENYLSDPLSLQVRESKDMYSEMLARCRTRVVVAQPNILNNMLSTIFEGWREYVYKEYECTFKVRDPNAVCALFENHKYVIGVDIKEFDSNVPRDIYEGLISRFPVPEWVRNIIMDIILCPWFVSDADGKGTSLISESWLNGTYNTWKGNPSGIFMTSFINNLMAALFTYVEYREELKGISVHSFLKHQGNVKCIICGDDAAHVSDTVNLIERNFRNEYVIFEKEDGLKLLGILYYRANNRIDWCLDILSFYSKTFVPERPIDNSMRRFPYYGIMERIQLYQRCPAFSKSYELQNELWFNTYKFDFDRSIKDLGNKDAIRLANLGIENSLSEQDIEILLDPNKIYYKFDIKDLNDQVVDELISRTDMATHERILNFVFKGE